MKVILFILLLVTNVQAQEMSSEESSSTTKIPTSDSAAARKDIDDEITNARLRAATGAKSLLSLQSMFIYNGGSIQAPLSQIRPQLSPGTIENDPAKLTGQISAKYRMTDHDNLNVGIGVGWITPTYAGQRGQAEDPYVAYGRVFKMGNVQNVLNVQVTKYTAASSVQNQLNYETDIDHTFLVSVGKTKLQLGVDIGWSREFYTAYTGGTQDELFAYPFAEYGLTERLSLRTVFRGLTFLDTTAATTTFTQDTSTQSLGVGISVARDIYLYPNIQWVWSAIEPEKTNVALQANINL